MSILKKHLNELRELCEGAKGSTPRQALKTGWRKGYSSWYGDVLFSDLKGVKSGNELRRTDDEIEDYAWDLIRDRASLLPSNANMITIGVYKFGRDLEARIADGNHRVAALKYLAHIRKIKPSFKVRVRVSYKNNSDNTPGAWIPPSRR